MKKQTIKQTKVKSKTGKGTDHASSVASSNIISISSAKYSWLGRGSNPFQVQNIGKDPPGRARSPGTANCQHPDIQHTSIKNKKTLFITEFQFFKQIQNPNFFIN